MRPLLSLKDKAEIKEGQWFNSPEKFEEATNAAMEAQRKIIVEGVRSERLRSTDASQLRSAANFEARQAKRWGQTTFALELLGRAQAQMKMDDLSRPADVMELESGKFLSDGSFTIGGLRLFEKGLESLIDNKDPKVDKADAKILEAMKDEHLGRGSTTWFPCFAGGRQEFTTTHIEWCFVVHPEEPYEDLLKQQQQPPPPPVSGSEPGVHALRFPLTPESESDVAEQDKQKYRFVRTLAQIRDRDTARKKLLQSASVHDFELIALRLFTGPLWRKYMAAVRHLTWQESGEGDIDEYVNAYAPQAEEDKLADRVVELASKQRAAGGRLSEEAARELEKLKKRHDELKSKKGEVRKVLHGLKAKDDRDFGDVVGELLFSTTLHVIVRDSRPNRVPTGMQSPRLPCVIGSEGRSFARVRARTRRSASSRPSPPSRRSTAGSRPAKTGSTGSQRRRCSTRPPSSRARATR